ncbi:hypothetical protein [Alkalicoccobacillus gibsonii]|uniref:hypothetical protein n=1 Tax=Alkalicoccobacillus gibsonii TaxID=79881 RepID=UPI00193312E9|nr:hypothetical protein [Alkalicoccobacillus gibsonii]MBM0066524.1 hypothetical protein [Alkalicoccobacillus gibsonii]
MRKRTLVLLVFSMCAILFGCQAGTLSENKTNPTEVPSPPLTIVPPLLTVTINDEILSTTQGSYCWSEERSKKHSISECADTEDPLLLEKAKEGEAPSFAPNSNVTISYSGAEDPKTLGVVFQTADDDSEVEVTLDQQDFELPDEPGVYYYRTFASWDIGDTSHAFRVAVD